MKHVPIAVGVAVLVCTPALADNVGAAVNQQEIPWGDAPPFLPKDAKFAVVSGDPSKNGLYVIRAKLPANYKIPAHHHPTDEHVTVLSGSFHLGMGNKLDASKGKTLGPGGFAAAPASMNHFAWTTEPTVIQVHGLGPFEITYVDPADDPRH